MAIAKRIQGVERNKEFLFNRFCGYAFGEMVFDIVDNFYAVVVGTFFYFCYSFIVSLQSKFFNKN